jgi:hypothetical protein
MFAAGIIYLASNREQSIFKPERIEFNLKRQTRRAARVYAFNGIAAILFPAISECISD